MKTILRYGLLIAAIGTAAPAAADVNICIWGTITGPDALVNGMSYAPGIILSI